MKSKISPQPVLAIAIFVMIFSQAVAQPVIPNVWDQKNRLTAAATLNTGQLRFLTSDDFPPFSFRDPSGALSGFHIDLARAICLELRLSCTMEVLPFGEIAQALDEGRGDAAIAGLAITPENARRFAFTTSYLGFPARFFTRSGNAVTSSLTHRLPDLADRRVGVITGTAHEAWLTAFLPAVTAVTFQAEAALRDAVAAGSIDYGFSDGLATALWLASEAADGCCAFSGGAVRDPRFFGHGLAIAVPRTRPELVEHLDIGLDRVAANGQFGELYLRYFPIGFY